MALPLTLIVITGEIDLSVASMLGLSGVLMAELFKHGWPIWPAMIAAVVLGVVLGAFNGFLVTRLGLPSLAVTIGTLTLYRGIAQGILPTDTIGGFPTHLTNIGVVPIPGTHIPYSIAFFVVLAVIFAVVLHATPLGRAIFAIGAGQEAAFFAGHPRQADQVLAVRPLGDAVRVRRRAVDAPLRLGPLRLRHRDWSSTSSRSSCSAASRSSAVAARSSGVVLAVAVLGSLQTALTADLMPAQDQNIVVGALLLASVIVPNARRHLPARPRAAAQRGGAAGTGPRRAGGGTVRVGIFGIGLAAYWPQFEGLRERLEGYQRGIEARLETIGAEVVSAGLVDTAQAARQAGETLAAARVDLVLLYTATYATSSQVLPAVQAVDAPVVILNLQPTRTLDYEAMTTGEWLANCSACCVPEIAGAFTRARIPYRTVTGTLLDGDPAWDVLREWLDAARAVRSLRTARIGFLGHTYPGMLDMYSDFTQVHAQTGAHVEVLEIDDLVERVESVDAATIERKGEEIRRDVRSRRRRRRPDRGRDHARDLRLVGAGRGRARPAGRGLRPGRADLLLPRRRRQHRRARRGRPDRRQLAAHGARRAGLRRGRPEDEHRDAPARPARRRRLVHRVLRARLRRRVRPDGSRRPRAPGDRRRSAGRARAQALPRQGGRRTVDRDEGPARAGDDPRRDADRGRPAEAARRRRRVDRRSDVQDRQHELADPVRNRARPRSSTPGAPKARRTTSRSASVTSCRACARSPICWGSSSPSSSSGTAGTGAASHALTSVPTTGGLR